MKSMNNIIAFSISTLYNVRQSRLSTESYFCNISYNKAKQPICLLYDMLSYEISSLIFINAILILKKPQLMS